jgi:heme-degrading monooxygenase HmoA
MVVVLFRSRLADPAEGYAEMAEEMLATAKTMPGFVEFKSFKAEDGERLSVVHWENDESMTAWRQHARHLVAQRLGREKWYESYSIEVAEVVRSRRFDRTHHLSTPPTDPTGPIR